MGVHLNSPGAYFHKLRAFCELKNGFSGQLRFSRGAHAILETAVTSRLNTAAVAVRSAAH